MLYVENMLHELSVLLDHVYRTNYFAENSLMHSKRNLDAICTIYKNEKEIRRKAVDDISFIIKKMNHGEKVKVEEMIKIKQSLER